MKRAVAGSMFLAAVIVAVIPQSPSPCFAPWGEGGDIILAPVDQPVEVSGGGLYRAVFGTMVDPVLAGSKLLTIQLGRRAEDNPQDTNPGEVRIEAVRISYTTRRPS